MVSELNIAYEKLGSKHVSVQLLDIQGRLILEEKVPKGLNQQMSIDMIDIKKGIYLLRFIDRTHKIPAVVTYKIIKN